MNELVEMPSGLLLFEHTAKKVYKKTKRPIAIDLFAGCGGFSLGLIQAGYEIVAAVENDPTAALTYMCNLGTYPCQFHFVEDSDEKAFEKILQREIKRSATDGVKPFTTAGSGWISHEPQGTPGVKNFFLGDVRKISGIDILTPLGLEPGDIDIVVGGPPCQGFSTAGKRNIADPRNNLVFEFARLICELQPKTICFENVPGIVGMMTPDGVPVLDAFCRILEDGDMGGHDAFMKSIKLQGVVGLMKSKRPVKKTKKKAKKTEKTLFDK